MSVEPEPEPEPEPQPVLAPEFLAETVIDEGRSDFNHVLVTQQGSLRRMHFVTGEGRRQLQSTYDLERPDALDHVVFQTMISALLVQPRVSRMLMVGVGGAQVTNYLFRRIEGLEIDAVDICPQVIRLAQAHFGVPKSDRYRFHVADGRVFIEEAPPGHYDLLVMDAFRGHSVPAHLRTQEFFAACADRLAPGGVMVVNMHRRSKRYDSDRATLASVFANCYRFSSVDDVQTSIVCSRETQPVPSSVLMDNARNLQPDYDFDLFGLAGRVSQEIDWTGNEVRRDAFDSGQLEQSARDQNLSCDPNCAGDR